MPRPAHRLTESLSQPPRQSRLAKLPRGQEEINESVSLVRKIFFSCIIVHIALGLTVLGLGLKTDIESPTYLNYLEVRVGATPYMFPVASATSALFFMEAIFLGLELYLSFFLFYWESWINKHRLPLMWVGLALSDAWSSTLLLMLEGIGGVGFLFMHGMIRASVYIIGGWVTEKVAWRHKKASWGLVEGTVFRVVVPWEPLAVAGLLHATTLIIRWIYFIVSLQDEGLPTFVWVAFFVSHLDTAFFVCLVMALFNLGRLKFYYIFRITMLFLALLVKTTIGLTIGIGAFLQTV